jgi:hypothetical protein
MIGRRVGSLLGVFLVSAATAACSSSSSSADNTATGNAAALNESANNNTDVQVINAHAWGDLHIGMSTEQDGLDFSTCTISDEQPDTSSAGLIDAKGDCTDPLIARRNEASIDHVVEPLVWLRKDGNTITSASFRYWCAEVEVDVAVKAAAWDSPSFQGIGFFADAGAINVDQTRTLYSKSDPHLKRIGQGTLRGENHEPVYLYRFTGGGPCGINGDDENPTSVVSFKPYVTYDGGIERWEAVTDNHTLSYGQTWSRQGDLLD